MSLPLQQHLNFMTTTTATAAAAATATTTTPTTAILWPFVWDYPGEPVPKETFTRHTHPTTNYPPFVSSIHHDPQHPCPIRWAAGSTITEASSEE